MSKNNKPAGDLVNPPREMRYCFKDRTFTIRVCPGPLLSDGEEADSVTHNCETLLSGDMPADYRLWAVLDELRKRFESWYGPMNARSVVTFTGEAIRLFEAIGGDAKLQALQPMPTDGRAA